MFPNRLSPTSDAHLIPDAPPPGAGAPPSQSSNNHSGPQLTGHPGQGATRAWTSQLQQQWTTTAAANGLPVFTMSPVAEREWQALKQASSAVKQEFMNNFQGHLKVSLLSEDEVSDAMIEQESKGNYTESQMDDVVAGKIDKTATGSLGAGQCILGFVHARTADGRQSVGSIHSSISLDHPKEAYDEVILPLLQNAQSQLAQSPQQVDLYFAGGNKPESFDSCLALASAVKNLTSNVPHVSLKASMLGMNEDEEQNMHALLLAPSPTEGNARFMVAKLDE
jgi:hypothetical protein